MGAKLSDFGVEMLSLESWSRSAPFQRAAQSDTIARSLRPAHAFIERRMMFFLVKDESQARIALDCRPAYPSRRTCCCP